MLVENWMTPDPVTLPPDATISAAAIEMGRHKFRHVLVATRLRHGKKLVGIVSKYDIARAFPKELNPFSLAVSEGSVPSTISTIMSSHVVTVLPSCDIQDAAQLLRARHFNALPVIRDNLLVGIITESDVFAALLNMTGADGGGIKFVVECAKGTNPTWHLAQLSQVHNLEIQSLTLFARRSTARLCSILRFAARPPSRFVEELYRLGFRILHID
jgi:acetoin utilization protein AcuB